VTGVISRCIACGQFFDSKKELKEHRDKNHRITDAKMVVWIPEMTDNVKKINI
jgi:hypothetical protein